MENKEFITFEITDIGIISIKLKNYGEIGDLVLNDKNHFWNFLPKENFIYKSIFLAIILNKLNELNNYKRKEDL